MGRHKGSKDLKPRKSRGNLSQEHKDKLKKPLIQRGHSLTCTCCMCKSRRKEFIFTPNILKKMSIASLRRSIRPEHSKLMKGKGNPRYIDGRSKVKYTPEFNKRLRRKIWERDFYTCQNCTISMEEQFKLYKQMFPIHHIDYNKQNCQEYNLITLCKKCNSIVNKHRTYWKEYLSGKVTCNGTNSG